MLLSLCETMTIYKGLKALLSLYETMTIYKGPQMLLSLYETVFDQFLTIFTKILSTKTHLFSKQNHKYNLTQLTTLPYHSIHFFLTNNPYIIYTNPYNFHTQIVSIPLLFLLIFFFLLPSSSSFLLFFSLLFSSPNVPYLISQK